MKWGNVYLNRIGVGWRGCVRAWVRGEGVYLTRKFGGYRIYADYLDNERTKEET